MTPSAFSVVGLGLVFTLAAQTFALDCPTTNGGSQTCAAADVYCYSSFLVNKTGNSNATTIVQARGCHNSTLEASNIFCPIQTAGNNSLVPADVAQYGVLNAAADVVSYYTCSSIVATTAPQTTAPPEEEEAEEVAEQQVGTVGDEVLVQPPSVHIGTFNIIILSVVTFLAFLGGFLVDIADTNKLMFKEA